MSIESPIQYEPTYLIYFSIDIRDLLAKCEDRPDIDGANSKLSVDHSISFEREGDAYQCSGKIDLTWIVEIEGAEENAEFVAKCGMVGAATCKYEKGKKKTLEGILAPNLIVYLWGKIRDLIETASMATPLDRMILPAINPVELLKDGEGHEESE